MSLRRLSAFAALAGLIALPALAQAPPPPLPDQPPAPFQPKADAVAPVTKDAAPDVTSDTWIFSGNLQGSHESFSGTLIAAKREGAFEMRLGGGATCDGEKFVGEIGLVRLPEITCSDDRTLRALFVPQGGKVLRVFGHVGDERFTAEAHLLGTEAVPEPKPSAAPHGPLGLPPRPPGGAPAPTPPKP